MAQLQRAGDNPRKVADFSPKIRLEIGATEGDKRGDERPRQRQRRRPCAMPAAIVIATAGVIVMSLKSGPAGAGSRATILGPSAGACFALSAIGFRGAILSLHDPDYLMASTFTLAVGLVIQAALLSLYLALRDRAVLAAIVGSWRPSLFAGFMGAPSVEHALFPGFFRVILFSLATSQARPIDAVVHGGVAGKHRGRHPCAVPVRLSVRAADPRRRAAGGQKHSGMSSRLLPPRPPKRWEFLRKVAALLGIPLATPDSDDKS